MVIVRRATVNDANALACLAERTFRDTFLPENNPSDVDLHCMENFGPDIQSREILDPNCVTILAEVEAEIIAFAQVRLLSPKDCVVAKRPSELHRLYVSNEWHGRGIAHQVMIEVLTIVVGADSDYIWLGVWEHNLRAIGFYRKYGFEVVGEHVFQFGRDPQRDLVMMVKVDPPPTTQTVL